MPRPGVVSASTGQVQLGTWQWASPLSSAHLFPSQLPRPVTAAEATAGVQPPSPGAQQPDADKIDKWMLDRQPRPAALTLRQASRLTLMPPDAWPLLPLIGRVCVWGGRPEQRLGREAGAGSALLAAPGQAGSLSSPFPAPLGRGPGHGQGNVPGHSLSQTPAPGSPPGKKTLCVPACR